MTQDEKRRRARQLRVAGTSAKDIGEQLGVSRQTAWRWTQDVEVGGSAPRSPSRERMALPDGGDEPPPRRRKGAVASDEPPRTVADAETVERVSAIRTIRAAVVRADQMIRDAVDHGNLSAAQRALRDLVAATTALHRIEAANNANGDGITITRDELDAAKRSWADRKRRLLSQPLYCEACGGPIRRAQIEAELAAEPGVSDTTPESGVSDTTPESGVSDTTPESGADSG